MMKVQLFSILFTCFGVFSFAQVKKQAVFDALKSTSKNEVSSELTKLSSAIDKTDFQAYKGALLMKEAQFLKQPKERLEQFKQGKDMLESAIDAESNNAEYRFLRLLIQENTPAILKYNSNIKADATFIKEAYPKLKTEVKSAVAAYAKVSKHLVL